MPKREGPYLVITNRSPTTYDVADPATPDEVLGTYHTNMMRPYELPPSKNKGPVTPIRRRGRPRTVIQRGLFVETMSEPEGESVAKR